MLGGVKRGSGHQLPYNYVSEFLLAIFHHSFCSLLCRRASRHRWDPGPSFQFLEAKSSFRWTHRPNENARIHNVTHSDLLASSLPSNASCATGQNRCRCCTTTSGSERLSENNVGGGERDDEVYAEHSVKCASESIERAPRVTLLSGDIYITRPAHKHSSSDCKTSSWRLNSKSKERS